jgi:FkbM family methyltransferase
MLNMIRAYTHYPYRIPMRVKFFNLFRYCVRFPWAEERIARRIIEGSLFWKKAVPPIYFYPARTFRRVVRNRIFLELDLSNLVDHAIFFGVPKEQGWEKLFSLAKPESIVFDVGANIGFLTLRFASICTQGRIYAFEPSKKNFECLHRNLALNNFSNINVYRLALGEQTEPKQLHEVYSFNTGANRILNASAENRSETISVDTLDNVVGELGLRRMDILKIDVEGYELFVLRGGEKTIQQFKPILFVELADDNLKAHGLTSHDIVRFIHRLDYTIFDAKTSRPLDLSADKIHTDVLCFPNHKN